MRKIVKSTPEKIKQLLKISNNGLKTFRYFEKRPLEIVDNHLLSLMLLENDMPIAYFHLEEEDGKVWVGMLIADDYVKNSIGKQCYFILLNFAKLFGLKEVYATTDKNGTMAKKISSPTKYKYNIIGEKDNSIVISINLENGESNG